jgi:hypothetical protein
MYRRCNQHSSGRKSDNDELRSDFIDKYGA